MEKKKKQLKTPVRLLIFLIIGFAIAMIFMTIAIYFGYNNAYSSSGNSYSVNLFGVEIYTLTKVGHEYAGTSIGMNMSILCMAFIAITVAVEEIIENYLSINALNEMSQI